jgi:small subunit ribosomal protein S3
MQRGAQGVRISVAGRLGGSEMSRRETETAGRVPRHTLRADIDYGLAEAHTTFGRIGVKAWIYKGEVKAPEASETHEEPPAPEPVAPALPEPAGPAHVAISREQQEAVERAAGDDSADAADLASSADELTVEDAASPAETATEEAAPTEAQAASEDQPATPTDVTPLGGEA